MSLWLAEIRVVGAGAAALGCIVPLFLYLYFSFCLFTIARKVEVEPAWLAFVPIANLFILVEASGRSMLWILAMFIPVLNIVAVVWIGMGLAGQRGREPLLGILLVVPVLNLVLLSYLAFFDPPTRPVTLVRERAEPSAPESPQLLKMGAPTERCAQCGTAYSVLSNWWNSGGYCSQACYRRAEEAGDVTSSGS